MKIPRKYPISSEAILLWRQTAARIGLRENVYVWVGLERWDVSDTGPISRIYFQIDEHQFETLTDLKKAIRLKAFL